MRWPWQTLPHNPQLFRSVCKLRHVPEQFVSPGGQTQLLAEQILGAVQAIPHAPQLAESALVLTQPEGQSV